MNNRNMPFVGSISPADNGVNAKNHDQLQLITNHSLCHVISQLGNLNNLASDLFEDLTSEAIRIRDRSSKLQNHINILTERYKSFNKKKPGENKNIFEENQEKELIQHIDQQVLRPNTRSVLMTRMYKTAKQPPALYKINPFRDDRRDGLSLYTDPSFFFQNWSSKMQIKEIKDERRRSNRRDSRQKDEKAPRKIKRKQDYLKDQNAALGSEFNPNFTVATSGKKRKRRKKKKMEGFSNKQYEKQKKKNSGNIDAMGTTVKHQTVVTNNEHDIHNKEQCITNEESDKFPTVPKRRSQEPDTPPSVACRYHAQNNENLDSLPLPPPPPIEMEDIVTNGETIIKSDSILAPNPYEFYPQLNDDDFDLPLPPPPDFDGSFDRDSTVSGDNVPFPSSIKRTPTRGVQNQNRTSTFMSNHLTINENSRICPSPPDYYDAREPLNTQNRNIPQAPSMPPPVPVFPIKAPHVPASNETLERQTPTGGLLFGNNSLLEMKEKLINSQDRRVPQIQPTQSDVHSIMKAIEGRRPAIIVSSSDEDSFTSDSDSEWE